MKSLFKFFRIILGIVAIFFCLSSQAQHNKKQLLPSVIPDLSLQARHHKDQLSPKTYNFSTFTRKYTNPGKFWLLRNKNFLSHPDAGYDNEYIPRSSAVEIFDKRTIDTKYYINKDTPSICYSQKSSGPMHYKSGGQWLTIDKRLEPKGNDLYEASHQEHPVGFDMKKKSSYIKEDGGAVFFNNWKLFGQKDGMEVLIAEADWSQYTAGDDGISFKNIFPGIDAEMRVSKGSIKTSFIVRANNFSGYDRYLLRDLFSGYETGNLLFSNGQSDSETATDADFKIGSKQVLHIKKGLMYGEKNPSSSYQAIRYELKQNELTLPVNADYLNTQLKFGNVVIDPMVEDSATISQGAISGSYLDVVGDCTINLNSPCPNTLMVPTPPAATIVDALFTFNTYANVPCARSDGYYRFAAGSCFSELWEGPDMLNGETDASDKSMGGNIVSCMPAPQCTSQLIPFIFSFYRTCNGPAGCDGNCVYAQSDLTITLVGYTAEVNDTLLSASPQFVCSGSLSLLTANAQFGVPPYNYTWYTTFGDSLLGSGNTISVKVPTKNSSQFYVNVKDA